ncbi:MAG TPA: SpoIIE family protein phosphatase [Candidatus Tectomicrobia bacterium]|nr:SpoIIE family protein phosphatase [Candidatus Tectomicrobia bacterium]
MPLHDDLLNGRAAAYHDNSWHGDDAYVSRELKRHIALDAVLDGATARGGAAASGYAAEVLRKATIETVDELTTLLEVANQQLFQRGKGRFFLTTASVALKIGSELHVVSVGDSSAFLFRGRDTLPLTGTAHGPSFLGLANTLGRSEKLSYKTTLISLQAQDRLVLATDGLIDNVAPSELAALVNDAASPEQAISALRQLLCDKRRENKGRVDDRSSFRRDDATAIIRYFGHSPRSDSSRAAAHSNSA